MHIRKNQTAKHAKQTAGLIRARAGKGGTSKADQAEAELLSYVAKHPGVTTKVAAWRLSGLPLNDSGYPDSCLIKKVGAYEFYKKRASDATAMPPKPGDSEEVIRVKLQRMDDRPMVYGPALSNPFTESDGRGLYLSGERARPVAQGVSSESASYRKVESSSVLPVDRKGKDAVHDRLDIERLVGDLQLGLEE